MIDNKNILTHENNTESSDDLIALKEFLLDIDCLKPLTEWTNHFNLFDILKITRAEIRHSNMLAWLLNPNENHGLGDRILRGVFRYAASSCDDIDIFDALLMDCYDFTIQREWRNIDILAFSQEKKYVLCIENKVDSREHGDQLNRYRKIIESNYPDYKKIFLFLSPEGYESSDPDHWYSMSYLDIMDIIEHAKENITLLPDAELLINNYIETIRREIVGDERIAQICAEIYAKHQKALDLIFENRPDRAAELAVIIKEWAIEMTKTGEIEIVLDQCNKSYIRFKTKGMSAILPDAKEAKSGWKTKNHYFYEIRNIDGKDLYMQLALSGHNIPDDLEEVCDRIYTYYPDKKKKQPWQWRLPYITKHSKVEDEFSEEKIIEQLNKKLREIQNFEKDLTSKLNSETV